MRVTLSIILVFFYTSAIIVQAQDTTYTNYDYRGNKVSKKKHVYYSTKSYYNLNGRYVEEKINKLGEVSEIRTYLTNRMKVLDGHSVIYQSKESNHAVGHYKNGEQYGKWKYYSNYLEKTENYDENGVLNGDVVGYFSNSKISYLGQYLDGFKVGEWSNYFESGRLSQIELYNAQGELDGFRISYYESGDTFFCGEKKVNERIGEWKTYYENGSLQHYQLYLEGGLRNGFSESYYKDSTLKSKGAYLKDSLDGVWNWFHPNGKKSSIEKYKNGELIEFQFYDKNGNEENYSDKPLIHNEFPGGIYELFKFLSQNINYPPIAQENGIMGRVVLRFIISLEGNISEIEIIKDIGGGCGMEAKRVVELMPQWTKCVYHNLNFDTHYTLPVKFTLE